MLKHENTGTQFVEEKLRLHLSRQRRLPYTDGEWARAKQDLFFVSGPLDDPVHPEDYRTPFPRQTSGMKAESPYRLRESLCKHFHKLEVCYYISFLAVFTTSYLFLPPSLALSVSGGYIVLSFLLGLCLWSWKKS